MLSVLITGEEKERRKVTATQNKTKCTLQYGMMIVGESGGVCSEEYRRTLFVLNFAVNIKLL
jgi:hypothetical protein